MIISASYKTDIPTFYGKWFMNRLEEGFCYMVNPYNRRAYKVDLGPESVDAFVFWTKNIGPFMPMLKQVNNLKYPFMVQYTINGYPRSLETSVVNPERSIQQLKEISEKYGSRVAVWRYDPIVFTSETPLDFHRRQFEALAKQLEGYTDEVVVSFAHLYKKTKSNLERAARENKFELEDLDDAEKVNLAREFWHMADSKNIKLTICSQDEYLSEGIEATKCVDAERLSDIAKRPFNTKLKGNRTDCGCYESRDIGEYDTCPHGCVYCYAVRSQDIAKSRYRDHDPESPFLFRPDGEIKMPEGPLTTPNQEGLQIPLILS